MATIRVTQVIKRVEDILQDTNVRWPRTELQNWLNDAYRAILVLRPDAFTRSGTFSCVAGTRQVLTDTFSDALRLIDIVRNVATTSNKYAVRQVDRKVLDDQLPGWHAESETVNIQHFMFDELLPKEFLVYPPASSNARLEVVYSSIPADHALSLSALDPNGAETEVIKLDDIYENAIIDWMLYRAYQKDMDFAANGQRSNIYYASFMQSLGAKTAIDTATDPKPTGAI